MFSIIIPLYNKASYVRKTVDSVLKQTYKNFELIIINDGSTDNSLSIVQQFNDPRIKIVSQKNQGVSAARNNGVKAAKFDYIAFLDADDWWDTNFLADMYNLVREYAEAGLYGCKYYKVKNGDLIESRVGVKPNFTSGYIDYFTVYSDTFWTPINCSFVVIKKSVFNDIGGFDTSLKFGEDFQLWVRIALKYKVAYLNQCLAYSNQDVQVSNRALGNSQNYSPDTHFIFNLGFLKSKEIENNELKILLDGLRVRSILDFYINNLYPSETQNILTQVDFSNQPLYYLLIYKCPLQIVKAFIHVRKLGSKVKSLLLKTTNESSSSYWIVK